MRLRRLLRKLKRTFRKRKNAAFLFAVYAVLVLQYSRQLPMIRIDLLKPDPVFTTERVIAGVLLNSLTNRLAVLAAEKGVQK